jgi:hypothetical protein
MAVPYTFATATGSIPLSQLDSNFSTGIVIGNTTVALGDTITTINNATLANVTITSGSFNGLTFSNLTITGTNSISNASLTGSTTIAGATMTGALTLNADPSTSLGAATKQYVDTGLATKQASLGYVPVNKTGDTMTGQLTLPGSGSGLNAATVSQITAAQASAVAKSGDTMTGQLTLPGGGSGSQAATVSQITAAQAGAVAKTGDTMSGGLSFTGSATRIQGDFSNATLANRTAFQDKTTNNGTSIYALPNGTATGSDWNAFNNSDPANSAFVGVGITSSEASLYTSKTGTGTYLPLTLKVSGVEVARFDVSGRFCLGVTSGATIAGAVNALGYASRSGSGGSFSGNVYNIYWNGSAAELYIDSSSIGSINVTSDYRIKQNVVTQTANAVDRVNALRPVTYQIKDVGIFKADGVTREGFIAHELAEVIPSAVNGVKDALTEDGNIQFQSLRLDPIIAVLTKAVQELSARIAALEAA